MEDNHAHAERVPVSYPSQAAPTVTWLIYVSLLLLCGGIAGALHIQLSRNPYPKERLAALALLGAGAVGASVGLAYSPY